MWLNAPEESIFWVLDLHTKNGIVTGFFNGDEDFHFDQDSSCCLTVLTKDTTQYIDVLDIYSFSISKVLPYSDMRKWRTPEAEKLKEMIGFGSKTRE